MKRNMFSEIVFSVNQFLTRVKKLLKLQVRINTKEYYSAIVTLFFTILNI